MSSAATPPSGSPRPSRNNTATLVVVVAVVIAVIVGFVALGLLVGGSDNKTAGGASATAPTTTAPTTTAPTTTAPTTPAQSTPTDGALSCTEPPALPQSPQQFGTPPDPSLAQASTWQVTMTTNCGPIVMNLDGKSAPQTVASFLFLSEKHFYDDVPCHRLTTAGIFVLQCGDPTGTGSGGPGYGYGIENAPQSGAYPAGSLAMANTGQPNSNGSQFFIVYADTALQPGGYSIFGTVVDGLPIVKAIAAAGTKSASDGPPVQPVSILSVTAKKL